MSTNDRNQKRFSFRFIDAKPKVLLELKNETEKTLRSIEILTVFLKDQETPDGGPSQAHIRFDEVKAIHPKDSALLSHKTWINGSPVDDERDLLERLKVIAEVVQPYVLDISWKDSEDKTQFQRIPVGH